ncbi:hypothetical protein CRX72_21570 [Pantoea sp. BRM17]|nr:hypothetical protein CRX72_21570 [Pantoea sp. BRM17]
MLQPALLLAIVEGAGEITRPVAEQQRIDAPLGGGLGVKGTIGQQVGDKGWSDTAAAISISYRF